MAISRRTRLKPYAAEFLGTTLLVLIGDGVVAQCLLSDYTYGTWLSINLAWAAAVVLTLYIAHPSPACNPAITLALALLRRDPTSKTTTATYSQWRQLFGKLLAQFLGGFTGAALVYAEYYSAIARWDPEYTIPGGSILSPQGHHSAGIFATYPSADFKSNWEAVLTETIGASVLMFGVLAINDNDDDRGRGRREGKQQQKEFAMFALLLAVGAACGWQTGYAVNPARDFGPRVFSSLVYGREVFSAKGWYFLVPLFAPVLGCLLGTVGYDLFLYEGRESVVTEGLGWLEGRGRLGSIRLGDGDEEEEEGVEAPGAWRD